MKIGFEAEFICPSMDYMDFSEVLHTELGVNANWLSAFDSPTWDSTWYTCEDSTIDDEYGNGIEIVSPPLAVPDSIRAMWRTLELIRIYGFTNNSCGMHMTISGNKPTDIKSVINNTNDNLWLRAFNRDTSLYAKPTKIHLDCLSEEDLTEKTYSINSHNKRGIEFRHIGGANYEYRWPLIQLAISDFLMSLNRSQT